MKCFTRLMMRHMKTTTDWAKDCHQYANRHNQSSADAIAALPRQAPSHLENWNSYMGLLFQKVSSEFNTITAENGVHASSTGIPFVPVQLDPEFLTGRPQCQYQQQQMSTIIIEHWLTPELCAQPTAVQNQYHFLQSSPQPEPEVCR